MKKINIFIILFRSILEESFELGLDNKAKNLRTLNIFFSSFLKKSFSFILHWK